MTVDGRTVRWDDLTVAEAEQVEAATGVPYEHTAPFGNATHARAVCRVLGLDPDQVRVGQFVLAPDDLPDWWDGNRPVGGRPGDGRIVSAVRAGFTPRQIRDEFTIRDLHLLASAPQERP